MKQKWMMATACLAAIGTQAVAQTQYDAARLTGSELNGTARFVGLGGAMGALGADISVIGTNPAGIGLYRSNEVSASFGFNATAAKSNFGGTRMDDSRTRASFDQAGFVYSTKVGNRTSLRYLNFGFNYHKSKNFNRLMVAGGGLNGLSQTQQMANMMEGAINSIAEVDRIYEYNGSGTNPYSPTQSDYPYLGVMGVRTDLVGVRKDETGLKGWNGDASGYKSREEGGIQQYDFNISFNVEDRMYFGATLGVYDVDYKRTTYYTEDIYDGAHEGFYELQNWFRTEGTGVDFKVGAIFRPLEDSPFRFGLAVHTPTWYTMTDTYASDLYSEIQFAGEEGVSKVEEYTPDYVNGATLRDYELRTPWKFNASLGTVVGGIMALGAEYEFSDYGSSKLYYDGGDEMYNQSQYIKEDLKGVHTLRIGMETRIVPEFSLRAGYNYSTSGFEKTAYKALDWNDMRTDTEYENHNDRHTVTVGMGYRGKAFFADLAYKYDLYKSDFYAFSADALQATKLDNERHQVLMTVGFRF